MYAQKLEGDSWKGEKMDMAKVEKMSGMLLAYVYLDAGCVLTKCRSAARSDVRTYAGDKEEGHRRQWPIIRIVVYTCMNMKRMRKYFHNEPHGHPLAAVIHRHPNYARITHIFCR